MRRLTPDIGLASSWSILHQQEQLVGLQSIGKITQSFEKPEHLFEGIAFSAYKQTLTLATTLGVPVRDIRQYAYAKAGDFALHAFLKNDVAFFKDVQHVLMKKGLKPSFKSRLLHFCLQIPLIPKGIRSIYFIRYPQN